MARGKGGAPAPKPTSDGRNNGKARKKRPKVFDHARRRLVTES